MGEAVNMPTWRKRPVALGSAFGSLLDRPAPPYTGPDCGLVTLSVFLTVLREAGLLKDSFGRPSSHFDPRLRIERDQIQHVRIQNPLNLCGVARGNRSSERLGDGFRQRRPEKRERARQALGVGRQRLPFNRNHG
jgi:hypothetical protein